MIFLMIFYTFGNCSSRSVSCLVLVLCLPKVNFPQSYMFFWFSSCESLSIAPFNVLAHMAQLLLVGLLESF